MILCSEKQIHEYTAVGGWSIRTINDLFIDQVTKHPENTAVADPPNREKLTNGAPLRLSYMELKQAVDRLAFGFIKAGIKKDDIIMIQLPNVVELVITYLAISQIGAIASPLPVQYRSHELKYTMSAVEPKAFVTTTNCIGFNSVALVQSLQSELSSLKTVFALGEELPDNVVSLSELLKTDPEAKIVEPYYKDLKISANDIFTICWTSGTESDPKGVPRSHNHWIAIAYALVDGCQLYEGCNVLCPFPLINMSSIGGVLVPWLLTGGAFVLHHPIDLPVMLGQISSEKINYTVIPPAGLNMLAQNPAIMSKVDFSSVKSIGSGSAPLSPWMVREFQEKHGINVINIFGSNEGMALVSGPEDCPNPDNRAQYFPRWGNTDFSWKNRVGNWFKSKLVDPATGEVITEKGIPGELHISGPTVFAGYYKRPDLTEKSFDNDGYYKTGDMFTIEGEGDNPPFYRFTGRYKDIIIRGGMKISSEEIEHLIIEHPKVADVAVIGYPDSKLGEKICAVIVPQKDNDLTLEELNEFLRLKDFAVFKTPEKLVLVDALIRNPVGKVIKTQLRQLVCKYLINEQDDVLLTESCSEINGNKKD